jgi:DNA-binding NtrC family response regulator
MTSIPFGERRAPAPYALVIAPALPDLLAVLSTLPAMGFDVTVAEKFQDAKESLASSRPALFVTGIKLGNYNGLHLVLRGTTAWPGLPCIVVAETADPVLRDEAERLGATFVVMPAPHNELAAAVSRTVLRPAGLPFSPIRPPYERRHNLPETARVAGTERRRNVRTAILGLANA